MGIPSSQLPSHSLGRDPGVKRVARANDRLSTSLPSLQEHTPRGEQRPFSANGAGLDAVDAGKEERKAKREKEKERGRCEGRMKKKRKGEKKKGLRNKVRKKEKKNRYRKTF